MITVAKIREAGRVLGSLRMGIPLDILLALIALFLIPRYWPLVLQP